MTEKEIEIRELESRLAELKNGMRKQNALEHIKKVREYKVNAKAKEIEDLTLQYSEMWTVLSCLVGRVEDLLDIAKAFYDNKMSITLKNALWGKAGGLRFKNHYYLDEECDGIGVNVDNNNAWIYFGYYNKKADNEVQIITSYERKREECYDLNDDRATNEMIKCLRASITAMNYFAEHFDEFEQTVYDCVNSL